MTPRTVENIRLVDWAKLDNISVTQPVNLDTMESDIATNASWLATHIADVANPHSVTKTQVGLGSVDNTSDLAKPISTATQAALNLKVDKTTTINGQNLSGNVSLTTTNIPQWSNLYFPEAPTDGKQYARKNSSWNEVVIPQTGHTIEDEGTPLTQRTKLNFVGSGVTATDDAGNDATVITIPTGGHTIKDEWTPLAQRANLNFIGSGVVATDNVGTNSTDVTITAGTSAGYTDTFTGNNTDNIFTLTNSAASNIATVSINGVVQAPTTDYSISGTTLTFVVIPETADEIVVSYYYATGAFWVSTISVNSSNGFAGTSSGGTTPSLTLSTTVSGLLKGNWTSISAAGAGTDFVSPNGAITGATKTKITYDSKGLVTSGADATTADIAASTNKNYVTDAQATVIGNTSGSNSGDNATNTQYSGLATSKENTGVAAGLISAHAGIITGVHGLAITVGKVITATDNTTLGGGSHSGTNTGDNATNSQYFTASETTTLTNKRITKRTGSTTSSATPTINTDNYDQYLLTAQSLDITSFTTNLTGTPTEWQLLWISITGTASRAITWGTSFESSIVALPTTTSGTTRLDVWFVWNTVSNKFRCVATA